MNVGAEQKCMAALTELLSGPGAQSAWARKSKMLMLKEDLGGLDILLLEFDVALKFSEAKELARCAEKIFQADKSERVRHRIVALFAALLSIVNRQFSKEVVEELSLEMLQEMFFFAFSDQRNSARGSLQVYLIWAANHPQSLRKIATKLFAYYLGASGEFQRKCQSSVRPEEEVTPLDAVLFYLFDSLVQADFGDLSLHNLLQLFHILLRNCFADSMGQLDADFYTQAGIPLLSTTPRPSNSWHFCLKVLAQFFERRAQPALVMALQPIPESTQAISFLLDKAIMENTGAAPELLRNVEFFHFVLCWSIASPIRNTQIDLTNQLVSIPANIFWVNPSALEHYWLYNFESVDVDSPAEIEELQQQKESKNNSLLEEPVRKLSMLFSCSSIAEQHLNAVSQILNVPNLHVMVVLALMLSGNWKRAAELLKHFESIDSLSSTERSLLRFQQLQTLIQLRQLPSAYSICLELIRQHVDFHHKDMPDGVQSRFPLRISQELVWIRLCHQDQLRQFLLLHLFHIYWLAFAKCASQQGQAIKGDDNADFLFLSLVIVAQSCWADFGFGLFEQLCQHMANKDQLRCPNFFRYVTNEVLMDDLLLFGHVRMAFSADGVFLTPADWHKNLLEGTVGLARKPALELLELFLEETHQRMIDLLQTTSK